MIRAPLRQQQDRVPPTTANTTAETRGSVPPLGSLLIRVTVGAVSMLLIGFTLGRHVLGSCNTMESERRQVEALLARGESEQASGIAELHLGRADACEDAKMRLAALSYRASMATVMVRIDEDGPRAVSRWHQASQKAQTASAAVDGPIEVADAAYRHGLWQLARAAFLQWWGSTPDRTRVPLYYATLFNWASELLASASAEKRSQGLTVLRTACDVSRIHGLPQREACQRLEELLDPALWPPPLPDDPLLVAA
jgi:hypothetical protein